MAPPLALAWRGPRPVRRPPDRPVPALRPAPQLMPMLELELVSLLVPAARRRLAVCAGPEGTYAEGKPAPPVIRTSPQPPRPPDETQTKEGHGE